MAIIMLLILILSVFYPWKIRAAAAEGYIKVSGETTTDAVRTATFTNAVSRVFHLCSPFIYVGTERPDFPALPN